jgi:hypothetical protein
LEHHSVGQKICLWQIAKIGADVLVVREVVVRITEVVDNPFLTQNLTAIDQKTESIYVKTLEVAKMNRSQYQFYTWCERDDGELPRNIWSPIEAVAVYNTVISTFEGAPTGFRLLDHKTYESVIPKGDVRYCEEHDQYVYVGNTCLMCATKLVRV